MSSISKVVYGNTTVMDITDSTVNTNNLLSGEVAYGANGDRVVGSVTVPSSIDDLSDVTISSPSNGQVLKYDSESSKWENDSLSIPTVEDNLTTQSSTNALSANQGYVLDNKISNAHKVTNKAVDLTSWTTDTTSQSGTTLYKKQITVSHVYTTPSVDIGASTGNVLPTTAEQTAYDLVQYVTVDDTVPCLYLYASNIPTTAFYINVEGVD